MGVRRWVWVWEVGVDVEGREGVISEGVVWDGVGDGYSYEYRSVEREGVMKRVCSRTHIDMLHLLCTSLTLSSSKYCTQ